MKRHPLKHMIQFTAAMALCITVLADTPSGEASAPEEYSDKINIAIENPADGKVPPQAPEIEPLNDQYPDVCIPKLRE